MATVSTETAFDPLQFINVLNKRGHALFSMCITEDNEVLLDSTCNVKIIGTMN
jgi:hypothetical protein